jgi:hypothetical protein
MRLKLGFLTVVFVFSSGIANAQGGKIIRIPTPTNARCINRRTDEVTITLRRIVTQKTGGFFTETNKAGVAVLSTLNADNQPPAKTPSVNVIDVKTEPRGQVSLPLEYPIASNLVLRQGNAITNNMQLDLYLEKTRDRNGFGNLLNTAGEVLGKLPIPANPFLTATNQFLDFANKAIQKDTTDGGSKLFASITLQFNDGDATLQACMENDKQTTGAIAVVSETGAHGVNPLPVADLQKNYCWRYSTDITYEVQYVAKPATGICTSLPASAPWTELPNDYVMLVVSTAVVPPAQPVVITRNGTTTMMMSDMSDMSELTSVKLKEIENQKLKRRQDFQESIKLCSAMALPYELCGVQ